jgi:hypothetical protein
MAQRRITPPVRVRYPKVFEKTARNEGDTPNRSVRLQFDKRNPEHMAFLTTLHEDSQRDIQEKWSDPNKRPRFAIVGNPKSPIKDGDTATDQMGIPMREKYPELAGHFFMYVSNYNDGPMPVFDRSGELLGDRNRIYSGCWAKVNVNVWLRDRQDNPGISIGMNAFMFWADDEPWLDRGMSVAELFGDEFQGRDDPANYPPTQPPPAQGGFGGHPAQGQQQYPSAQGGFGGHPAQGQQQYPSAQGGFGGHPAQGQQQYPSAQGGFTRPSNPDDVPF